MCRFVPWCDYTRLRDTLGRDHRNRGCPAISTRHRHFHSVVNAHKGWACECLPCKEKIHTICNSIVTECKRHPSGWMLACTDDRVPVKSHWRRIIARERQLRGAKKIVASKAGTLQKEKPFGLQVLDCGMRCNTVFWCSAVVSGRVV